MMPINSPTNPRFVMNGVNRFCGSKSPGGRWASWHYCFSYFQEVRFANLSGSCYSPLSVWDESAKYAPHGALARLK